MPGTILSTVQVLNNLILSTRTILVAQTVKNPPQCRKLGLIPGSGRAPGEDNGYPLQHSCLENPMDSGAWQAAAHGITNSRARLSDLTLLLSV